MTPEQIKNGIELLCETSLKVKSYYEDDTAIVDALNKVSKEDLSKCLEYYDTRSGVVIDLRKELINRLFNDEVFTKESLYELLSKHKQGKENQYKSYKHLYSIFYPPITFYGHNQERKFISEFIDKLIKDLDLENHIKITSFDFQGPRQQGSDRYWIAIYNKTQENQSSSLQIFIEFFHGTIGYGIYQHKSKSYLKPKVIAKPEEFSYDSMLTYLEEQKEFIINDIQEAPPLLEIDLKNHKLFKISHGSFKANKYKHIIKALKDNNWIVIHESTGKGRAEDFKTKVKKGDYVYITLGAKKLIGIARVTSDDYGIVPSDITDAEGWLYRDVEMIQYPTSKNLKDLDSIKAIYPSGNTSLFEIKHKDLLEANDWLFKPYFNTIFKNNDTSFNMATELKSAQPLNQILYGPPGTGKTYKTKKIAIEIIESIQYSDSIEDREIILEKYDEYVKSNQIHFTTFHQSMSYEDFIEGIKPKMNDDEEGELSYEIQNGIFKTICDKAKKSKNTLEKGTGSIIEIEPFDTAWNNLIESVTEQLANTSTPQFNTLTNKKINAVGITDKGNLLIIPSGGSELDYTVSYNRTKKLFNAFPDLASVKNIDKEFRAVIGGSNSTAYWSVLNYLHSWISNNEDEVIANGLDELNNEKQNYVLIIDEINRGNVSAIFGELITLIEKDKRTGEKESIQVTLPYSKTSFSVPNNLYIIGTMNTADRSVEALDTALRRRFSFEEVLPKPSLLNDNNYKEVDLATLVKTINKRVELLIDKDHQIGHSYFINIDSLDSLKTVFKDNIIPLLEEYFYGDFGKIGLVLGKAFVESTKTENKAILAKFKDYEDLDFVEDKLMFKLKNIDNMNASDFVSIYQHAE